MAHAFHLLTGSERECLRLVHEGHSSKNIAIQRNVRADSIDKILNSARAKLGGLPRRDAARLFVEHEDAAKQRNSPKAAGLEPTQFLGAQPLGVAKSGLLPSSEPAEMPTGTEEADSAEAAEDDDPRPTPRAALAFPLLLGAGGRQRNDLSREHRAVIILIIAAASALIAGGALALLIVLNKIGLGR